MCLVIAGVYEEVCIVFAGVYAVCVLFAWNI